jgi:predicted dehydrogenase
MKILQVGIGRFGRSHLRTWQKLGVDLRLCDHDASLLSTFAEPHHTDWRTLIDDVDAVDVVTPAPAHAEIVRAALALGKHVLVEKPVTETADEGFALAREARRRGVVLQVGHVFRFAPESRAVAAALRAGAIGRPRFALAHFMGFKRPRSDGGIALSDAVHFVDLLSWLLGGAPRAVTATLHDFLGRGLDDMAMLALDWGDASAVVEANCFAPAGQRDLQLVGTHGAIACDFLGAAERVRVFGHAHRRDATGAWIADEGDVRVVPTPGDEPLLAQLAAFTEACRSGRPSPDAADGFDGAAAVAVVEAAARSAREGRRVEIALPPGDGADR